MYDPTVGSFLSEDPSGLEPDENPYRYVRNAPTMNVDPKGLESVSVVGGNEEGSSTRANAEQESLSRIFSTVTIPTAMYNVVSAGVATLLLQEQAPLTPRQQRPQEPPQPPAAEGASKKLPQSGAERSLLPRFIKPLPGRKLPVPPPPGPHPYDYPCRHRQYPVV